ncbi:hypothetical protein B0H65DRAFT_456816 [Neurospora tetraspora]|uniref:Uncharacterized protein n=1 Tax=Neurospora tetraspora TaxID=94610 RepID=A0AAE0MVI7_9PEZI|nr:hypothetical protein B0H65DRAFT_456816 [Neurospora tetraspora]
MGRAYTAYRTWASKRKLQVKQHLPDRKSLRTYSASLNCDENLQSILESSKPPTLDKLKSLPEFANTDDHAFVVYLLILEKPSEYQASGSGSHTPSHHGSQDQTFTTAATLPIKPVQTGQFATSNRPMSPASTTSQSKYAAAPVEADPFAVNTDAKAKEDFENAFASFQNLHAKPTIATEIAKASGFSKFDSEFSPISELEWDDESDSESEAGETKGGFGFDDDFAPASPAVKPPFSNAALAIKGNTE